jgi:carboxypeptidase Q
MKRFLCLSIFGALLTNTPLYAQNTAQLKQDFEKISSHILKSGESYNDLEVLCKTIGHRLTGSKAAARAVEWGAQTLRNAGCDTVWLQPVIVPVWQRGAESLLLQLGQEKDFISVPMLSLGNSEGTKGATLQAPIIMVQSFDELDALDEKALAGKIVFFNYPFKQELVSTFEGYGDAVKYRWQSPIKCAFKGVLGIIVRSISTGMDDYPHTGTTKYAEGSDKFPVVAIGNQTADRLAHAINKNQQCKARITSNCGMKGTAKSYNVIGEIKGSHYPDEYLVVGGHLDSWDVGEGAHDDGAGCVQAIEVLRTYKKLGMQPRHTLRAVLFMNEENGLKGGTTYADSTLANKEKHIIALESDAGGFSPKGIETTMDAAQRSRFQPYESLFHSYGIYDFSKHGGGADVSPLKPQNIVVGELLPDSHRYFDVHHTDADVFESVNHRELKMGAAVMTMFLHVLDTQPIIK